MKKFLSILIIATAVIAGCRKNDNPKLPDGIQSTPLPLLVQDTGSTVLIQDVAAFASKFSVQLYFPNGAKPKKFDLVVAMSGDYTNVKTLKADVTSFPTTVDVTGPQLAQLFGIAEADIVPGDYFEIRANITTGNGTFLEGFTPNALDPDSNAVAIAPYGTDVSTFPGSHLTITYRAVCPLNLDDFVGTYTLDDPDFWGASYSVNITRDGTSNRLKVTGFVQDPSAVIYLTVKESAQTITVPKQTYLPILPTTTYHNPSVEGTGVVNACNNAITLTLDNTVDEGSFGSSTVKIHK
jgi:hypothetical protein